MVSQSGQQVTATNETWNGAISSGGSTTFGLIVNGPNQPASTVSCTPR